IARSRTLMVALGIMAFLATSLILWWLNRQLVLKPVTALLEGTRRVADGDLATTIPVMAQDELGDLATAFNQMTHRLADTQLQLAQADKLASVGRLAAGVAHEINNPLTGVLSYASLLKKRFESDAEAAEDLDVIIRETLRCRGIIRELLDFARPAPPSRKPTDLNEVARHAVAVVMNQLHVSHVKLALDLAEDLPLAYADANQIQQVVVNLLLNAEDAIGAAGGEIRLSSRAKGGSVELNTEDNGQGIPSEDLPHLFEPFFSTKGTRGTGLGLAVTWGIVEGHGGTIQVQSEPGHGARFTVSLPVAPPLEPGKSASEIPST
ncbi:MAG: HAMP domain-containing protein, partial [Acidobacteriota bacterium]|nr:HAMP domain-containing protein [Acidobacteriota bacterium]